MYSRHQHTTALALRSRRETSRHTLHACLPYCSPHPRPMHPWEGTGGGGAVGHPQTRRTVEGGHGCIVMPPPASPLAANHLIMEGKENLGK